MNSMFTISLANGKSFWINADTWSFTSNNNRCSIFSFNEILESLPHFISESQDDLMNWTDMNQKNKIKGDKEHGRIQVSQQSTIFTQEEIFLLVYEPTFRTAFLTSNPLEIQGLFYQPHYLLETMQLLLEVAWVC